NKKLLATFLFGLGIAAHPTVLFLFPLLIASLVRRSGESASPTSPPFSLRSTVPPILLFLMGLSIYLYLPLRSAQSPVQNWGDPASWRNFWRVVCRADYGGLKLHPEQSVLSWTTAGVIDQLIYFLKSFTAEWSLLGVLLA